MKKIIHKLKKNQLVSKIAALFTICLILVSSFTVSSFAADEEDVSSPTDSITDVWTSVMNWITTSLGSVQGVFVSYDLVYSPLTLELVEATNEGSVYSVSGLDYVPSDGSVLYCRMLNPASGLNEVGEFVFTRADDIFTASVYLESTEFTLLFNTFNSSWALSTNMPLDLTSFGFTFDYGTPSSYSLTFLGTLAVIGVAIAIAFLLISVISRFLRLRG